ncbi:hypothetical protein [uncultured Sunxiuqinia sp.]|nr:hypothetical protein [uncultured Sunxiuqinia sp.]
MGAAIPTWEVKKMANEEVIEANEFIKLTKGKEKLPIELKN